MYHTLKVLRDCGPVSCIYHGHFSSTHVSMDFLIKDELGKKAFKNHTSRNPLKSTIPLLRLP